MTKETAKEKRFRGYLVANGKVIECLQAEIARLRDALEAGRNLANRVAEANALDCTVHGHYEIEEAEWLAIELAHGEYLGVISKGQGDAAGREALDD